MLLTACLAPFLSSLLSVLISPVSSFFLSATELYITVPGRERYPSPSHCALRLSLSRWKRKNERRRRGEREKRRRVKGMETQGDWQGGGGGLFVLTLKMSAPPPSPHPPLHSRAGQDGGRRRKRGHAPIHHNYLQSSSSDTHVLKATIFCLFAIGRETGPPREGARAVAHVRAWGRIALGDTPLRLNDRFSERFARPSLG